MAQASVCGSSVCVRKCVRFCIGLLRRSNRSTSSGSKSSRATSPRSAPSSAGNVEMRADDVLGELVRQLCAHVRTRVTTVRPEPLVPELGHQPNPQPRGLSPSDTRGRRGGEDRAGKRRDHDVERVGGVAAEALGMRERLDDLREVPERPRPTVREHERHGRRSRAALVEGVHGHTVDHAAHVRPLVHRCFVRAPVVPVIPVRDELAQVRAGNAIRPVIGPRCFVGPHRGAEPLVEERQPFVGDVDAIRLEGHLCPCSEEA